MPDLKPIETVLKHGHGLLYVFPDQNAPPGQMPFTYSYGRALKGRPDLLCTGPLPPERIGVVLNDAAAWDDEHPFEHGDMVDGLLSNYPVIFLEVPDLERAEMHAATNFASSWALQMVWPDADGLFPFEDGYNHEGCPQPLYTGRPHVFIEDYCTFCGLSADDESEECP